MKTHTRNVVSFMLAVAMVFTMAVSAVAADNVSPEKLAKATAIADILYEAGLFRGTGVDKNGKPIYDLESNATRSQAIVMLVRLLNKEAESKKAEPSPFTDVPDWAALAVNYAYAHGLTSGVGGNMYGANDLITNTQYITFCLRSLGYTDNDFRWDAAHKFAYDLGALTRGEYDNSTAPCSRADMVIITYAILNTKMKNSDKTLAENNGVAVLPVEQPVEPVSGLPTIVTEKIQYMDSSDPQYWYTTNKGNKQFSFSLDVPYGTVLTQLKDLDLEPGMSTDEVHKVFKEMETLFKGFNDNIFAQVTDWSKEVFSFNVGRPGGPLPIGMCGITYSVNDHKYKIVGELGANWDGRTLNREMPSIAANTALNVMYVVDHDMAQQVFAMLEDYYWTTSARVDWEYQDEPKPKSWVVFEGDVTPITAEFVQKYGLTYVSGQFSDPRVSEDGKDRGRSTVTVTNGHETWTIDYCMPNGYGDSEWIITIQY